MVVVRRLVVDGDLDPVVADGLVVGAGRVVAAGRVVTAGRMVSAGRVVGTGLVVPGAGRVVGTRVVAANAEGSWLVTITARQTKATLGITSHKRSKHKRSKHKGSGRCDKADSSG